MSKRTRQIVVLASIATLTLLIVFVTQFIILRALDSARDDPSVNVYFVVERDESVDSIAERLHDEQLIRSPGYFRFRVRLSGSGSDIVAGRYRLDSSMSTSQIIRTITSESAALAQEVSVQFIEGWRTEQFAEALVEAQLIESVDVFMDTTREPRWNDLFAFLHTRPSNVALEGYLFPDTYNFRADSTPDEIIERLLGTFEERVTPQMIAQADSLGLTLHQVITIASIVEREAVIPDERATIASVYYNRIARGMPLQADPTVQYQVGDAGDWWPELSSIQLQQQGRYNTYLNPNLPPGPICNPSLASIAAALQPANTDFLFFVATGDGTHAFARTFEEHEENIREFQRGN
ncbi:MAG TPA: endolytic transglycosylase MltG [Thermomicrobiales bacterium]|nr:endolytic transglycosylase MltG [Thermomicrobiales bacterium]